MPPGVYFGFVCFQQFFARVLPNGFEQTIARRVARVSTTTRDLSMSEVSKSSRGAGARGSRGEFSPAPLPLCSPAQTCSTASSVKPPAKTDNLRSKDALRVRQQIVTPIHRRAQRLMTRHRGATAARQQIETIIQPRRDFLRRQDFEPRGSQFDRKRNAVQTRTHLRGWRGVFHQSPICRDRRRALDEKLNRIILSELRERRDMRSVGQCERRHAPNHFAADVQRLAAGRHDLQLGTRTQQRSDQLRARAEQMLAVVNDEQQFFRAEIIREDSRRESPATRSD